MSNPRRPTPSYLFHKRTGRARAVWTDRAGMRHDKLLPGPYDSPESRTAFAQLQLEYEAAPAAISAPSVGVTVAEILLAYLDHADRHYRDPDGNPTEGVRHIRTVIRHVREVYGPVPASAFGPLALKAVRQRFMDLNWSRTTVSARRERLFGCACCRRVQDVFPRARDRAVLEIVERFADGNASDRELQEVSQIVDESRRDVSRRLQIESRSSTRRASARTEAERSALRELSSVTAP